MNAKIILSRKDLRNLAMSWYGNEDDCGERKLCVQLKSLTNNHWDNPRLLYENIYGDLYSLSVRRVKFTNNGQATNLFNYHLWDASGNSAIGHRRFTSDPDSQMPKEIRQEISELSIAYSEGKTKCSDCNKDIDQQDIAGRYFAGTYCKECWEREWKAREAKESYS